MKSPHQTTVIKKKEKKIKRNGGSSLTHRFERSIADHFRDVTIFKTQRLHFHTVRKLTLSKKKNQIETETRKNYKEKNPSLNNWRRKMDCEENS